MTPSPITPKIRAARPQDARALAALARATFVETFVEGFTMNYPPADLEAFLETSYAVERVGGWLDAAGETVLVAESGAENEAGDRAGSGEGTLLAFAQSGANTLPLEGAGPEDGELKRLYVARAAQGLGLGRRLLEAALEPLSGRRVLIGVWSGNDKALRLYERYGFRRVGAYKFAVGGVLDDEVILGREAPGTRT